MTLAILIVLFVLLILCIALNLLQRKGINTLSKDIMKTKKLHHKAEYRAHKWKTKYEKLKEEMERIEKTIDSEEVHSEENTLAFPS